MWLLAAFIAVPLVEIALFIQIGGLIGLWPTLLIVLLTAAAGAYLVRREGLRALDDLQRTIGELKDPTGAIAHGAAILLAGALLLTPGFFTDTVGLALLIPPVRRALFRWARARVEVRSFTYGQREPAGDRSPDVIEGEYREVDANPRPTHRGSGWTRH